jgi:tetratricopeptide (TPR) repeat protein
VVYAVSKITGIDNLFYFNLILWLIIIFELFLIIKIKTNLLNLPVYLPFFLMAVYLLLPFVVLRPHVFTYIFLLYFLYVLENEPIKKNYPLYFSLPFATIIWVNFHAATITGIFVITCYLIYYLIKKFVFNQLSSQYNLFLLIFSLIGIILASLISPLGINCFYIFSRDVFSFVKENISEWQVSWNVETFSENIFFILFYFYSLLYFFVLIYNFWFKENKNKFELIIVFFLTLTFFVFAVLFRRNIPLFLLISFPFFIYYIDKIFGYEIIMKNNMKYEKVHNFFSVILIVLIFMVFSYFLMIFNFKQKQYYPEKTIKYISENKVQENIFTDMLLSGFFEYFLYPDYKVMLTTRFNYSAGLLDDYVIINNGGNDFINIIRKHKIKTFIIGYHSKIIKDLNKYNYKLIYFDDVAMIFTENSKKYFKYIRPYNELYFYDKNKKYEAIKELNDFIQFYPSEKPLLMYAMILYEIDKAKTIDFLKENIEKNREYYSLYNFLGTIYYEMGDYKRAMEILRISKKKNLYINKVLKESIKKLKGK